jgi:hypothetical protein
VINAAFWAMGMEDQIKANSNIDFVGEYRPNTFNFGGYKPHVKSLDLVGWRSPIMPAEVKKVKK